MKKLSVSRILNLFLKELWNNSFFLIHKNL